MPRQHRLFAILPAAVMLLACACGAAERAAAPKQPSPRAAPAASGAGERDFLASLDQPRSERRGDKEEPVYVTAVWFIGRLALVLALAYVTILGLKRFTNLQASAASGRNHVRVIETSPLGANRALHVVEVGSRRLLVGSTPNQVNLLAELAPEDLPEAVLAETGQFKDHLSAFLGSRPDTAKAAATVAEALRGSSAYLRDKVKSVGKLRKRFGSGEDA